MKLSGQVIVVVLLAFCSFTEGTVTISPGASGTTLMIGQNFLFNCTSDLAGQDLFFGPQPNRLNPNPPSGESIQFNFTSVTRDDNGLVFFCRDDDGEMMITLTVLFSLNYTNSTEDREINKGDALSVVFNLEGEPMMGENFSYTWTKDGVPFTSSSNVAITATSISITSAECSDNGLYNVTATNPLGSDYVSFRLTVLCPPTFEAGSGVIPIGVIAGQNFSINCRVNESYPLNPTITLTTPDSTMTDVTANPIRCCQNQPGTYVCRADNTRANTTLTYQVSVTMTSSTLTPSAVLPTVTPTITTATSDFPLVGVIIGVVVGVSVLACVISTLVPLLICCCLGVACFASIGCLAKKKEEVELAKL